MSRARACSTGYAANRGSVAARVTCSSVFDRGRCRAAGRGSSGPRPAGRLRAAGLLYPFFGIRLSPIIAAAAMALSSLSVVTNANRLRRYRPAALPAATVAGVEPQVQAGARAGDAAARQDGAGQGHAGELDAAAGGTTVTDPVCGMSADPATAPQHRRTPAGTVYFCSPGCAAAFDAGPDRYTTAARTASTVTGFLYGARTLVAIFPAGLIRSLTASVPGRSGLPAGCGSRGARGGRGGSARRAGLPGEGRRAASAQHTNLAYAR